MGKRGGPGTCLQQLRKMKPKATVCFTKSVKDFLNEIFRKGEETGQKLNPAEVSSQLRNMRTTDGNKIFHWSEWLTTQQITSYFS